MSEAGSAPSAGETAAEQRDNRRAGLRRKALLIAALLGASSPGCTRTTDGGGGDDSGSDSVVDVPPVDTTPTPLRAALCDAPAAPTAPDAATAAWLASLPTSPTTWVATARVDELEASTLGDDSAGVALRYERAWYRLRDGRVDDAIADLDIAVADAARGVPDLRGPTRRLLAVAWMRKAELQACVTDPTGGFCLVPTGDTLHEDPAPMARAAEILTTFLAEDDPYASDAAWLLNVTALARGLWPDAVPIAYRADASRLAPPSTLQSWASVATAIGIQDADIAGTPMLEDLDGNGFADVLTTSFDPEKQPRVWLQSADGSFCEGTHAMGLDAAGGVLYASPADFDNDGDLDIAMPRGAWYSDAAPVSVLLYRNDGTGRFTEVSQPAGLAETTGPSQVAVWADFDVDGFVDLFLGREGRNGAPPCSMYLNQRDGTFRDAAAEYGLDIPQFIKGASVGDVNGDGRPDLLVSSFEGEDSIFLNLPEGFSVLAHPPTPPNTFSSWMFDPDQDGDLDIYLANYAETFGERPTPTPMAPPTGEQPPPRDGWIAWVLGREPSGRPGVLWRNDGGTLVDVGAESGLTIPHSTMGSSFVDLDVDGWPDFLLGTGGPSYAALEPNAAYHNRGDGTFEEVGAATGLNHLQKGHGISTGDLDGDGDEDIVMSIGGAYRGDGFVDPVYVNPNDEAQRLTVRFRGVADNRDARGAHFVVETDVRTYHQWVGIGSSFGNNTLQVEQGLGGSTEILDAWVTWPNGEVESLPALRIGQHHVVEQGSGVVEAWALGRRTLGGGGTPPAMNHAEDTAAP